MYAHADDGAANCWFMHNEFFGSDVELRESLEIITDAFYIVDSSWRIVDVNRETEEWWRHKNRDVLGAELWDLLPEASNYPGRKKMEDAMTEQKAVRFINSTPFLNACLEVNVIPMAGGGLAIYFSDVSGKKRHEETLSYQAYLLNEISDAVISTDNAFCVTSWNRAAELIYGWSAEEVLGKNADEIFKAIFVGITALDAVLTLQKNGFIEIEVIHERKDGSKINILSRITVLADEKGRPVGTVGINRDITESLKQEEALTKSIQRDKILAELTSRLLECEDTQSILQDVCTTAMHHLDFDMFLNYMADPVTNRLRLNTYDGFPEADAAKVRWIDYGQGVCGTVAQKKKRIICEDLQKSHDRKTAFFTLMGLTVYACYPLLSKNKVIGTLGFGSRKKEGVTEDELAFMNVLVNDISIAMSRFIFYRRLAESEERALTLVEELKTADRNKNEFLNSLSHELRNPLATIVAGLSLLEITDEAGRNEVKDALRSQIGQLCRLVDDLLDLTRMTNNKIKLKIERADIRQLVLSSVKAHRALFDEKGITLETDISAHPLYVDGDSARLMQIIGNLLQNSHKYTDRGGKVSVRVYSQDEKATIVVGDNGIGIEPEFLPHLFEPFKQADLTFDRLNSGLGLGLSIVKGIAQMHGGTVTAASAGLGKGAVFTISLPLAMRAYKAGAAPKLKINEQPNDLRILLIDDNHYLANIMCSMLELIGYKTAKTYSGIEGIQTAKTFRPDVILCDIGLPGLNGFELARIIRKTEEHSGVCLIALSGFAHPSDKKRAFDAGYDHFIAKPVNIESLRQLLESITPRYVISD
jgi:PAS domain S-box-containing protein